MSLTESSEAERPQDRGNGHRRIRGSRAYMGLGRLGLAGLALVVVTVGLFVEARDASTNADAASAEASQLLDDLVADVKKTNDELSTFNQQFESAVASAQAAAAAAKQKQSERSSSNKPSP